jgi:hypothetical protein
MFMSVLIVVTNDVVITGDACSTWSDRVDGYAITDGAAATLTNGGGTAVAITGGVNAPTCGKDLVSLYAVHTNANTKSTTEKATSPASVGTSHFYSGGY